MRTPMTTVQRCPLDDCTAKHDLPVLQETISEDDKQRWSELIYVIERIHAGHHKLVQLSKAILAEVDQLQSLCEEEKEMQLLLDKCSRSSQVLYQKNYAKERRVSELREKLRALRNQSSV